MIPTIGRIVHYNSKVGPAAAIITYVHGDNSSVNLQVFRQSGEIIYLTGVDYGEHLGGWRWPPRA